MRRWMCAANIYKCRGFSSWFRFRQNLRVRFGLEILTWLQHLIPVRLAIDLVMPVTSSPLLDIKHDIFSEIFSWGAEMSLRALFHGSLTIWATQNHLMNDNFEIVLKEAVVVYSRHYSGIFPGVWGNPLETSVRIAGVLAGIRIQHPE